VSSVFFAVIGGIFAISAVYLWIIEKIANREPVEVSPEEELAEWVHQCRSDGTGRLVAAVCDTSLQGSHRLEALKEVLTQYTSLGLPSKEDAYKLLSAREDLDRALRSGVQDNDVNLVRACLVALSKYEIDGHCDGVSALLGRILTNPSTTAAALRPLAIRYLNIHGASRSESVLVDIMEMGTRDDRDLAIIGLRDFGTALAVPSLHATAADPAMSAIRGKALAAIGAIQARIGPIDNGLLSLSEDSGGLSLMPQGGNLSSANSDRRAV
jgi:hypothetical protein